MKLAGLLGGGASVLKRFQIGETMSTAEVPVVISAAADAGVMLATATSTTDMVGATLDAGTKLRSVDTGADRTYVTAQDSAGTAGFVTVVINADALWELLISGGAAAGTALPAAVVTTAQTDGLTVVASATNFTSPQMDSGTIWGYDGANVGQARKITTTADGTATVTVAFDNNSAVNDEYLYAPFWPVDALAGITLTSNLVACDGSAASSGTLTGLQAVEVRGGDIGSEGKTKSSVIVFSQDHIFNKGT